jgi:cytochrome c556
MKKLLCLLALFALPAAHVFSEDTRQLAKLTPEARETLRQEMFDNLLALNNILTMLAANQVKEAGEVAEKELGRGAMGKNRHLPFEARPGPQMPNDMHQLAISGHFAASEFATAAASGDQDKALAALPAVTGTCIACHASYRTR